MVSDIAGLVSKLHLATDSTHRLKRFQLELKSNLALQRNGLYATTTDIAECYL